MSEMELRDELLRKANQEANPEAGERLREAARSAIRRWRIGVRLLAGITIVLWTLVAGGALATVLVFLTFFLPRIVQMASDGETGREAVNGMAHLTAWYLQCAAWTWAALVVIAAASTVAFVLASRTATLRQIGASLAELTEELRRMRAVPRGPGAPPSSAGR